MMPIQVTRFLGYALLALVLASVALFHTAHAAPNAQGAPDTFIQDIANQVLQALQNDQGVKAQNMQRVNQAVDQYVFPYVDFEKTTRVAAGHAWRQMTDQQQTALIRAFRNKLVLIYSSALSQITSETKLNITTVRKVPQGKDVIVGSALAHPNKPIIKIAYRLEKTAQGWKIYDLNVENVWLIETYRRQFSQEVNQKGIDGLIQSLEN